MDWQQVAQKAQKHRDNTIARLQPAVPDVPSELPLNVTPIPRVLLSPKEVKITECSAEELITSIGAGRLTSSEVTNAFLRRAGLAQKLVLFN